MIPERRTRGGGCFHDGPRSSFLASPCCSSTRQMVASDEDTTPTYALEALAANLSIDVTPVGNIGGDAEQEFGLTSSTGANARTPPTRTR